MSYKIMPHHLQQTFVKPTPKSRSAQQPAPSFQSVLERTMESSAEIKISKHAEKRLQERGIHITPETWEQIQEKVFEARHKGVTAPLVVTNNAALVISATNQTVITAMDLQEAQAQLFTNINGAILMN